MQRLRYSRRVDLPAPVEPAFAWHGRSGALERLSPPWESIRVVRRDRGLDPGNRVVLEARIGPFPTRWVAEHVELDAGRLFRDVQREGPFAAWDHRHRFEATGSSSSRLTDEIEYTLPLGRLGKLVAGAAVRRRLERLFRYRHRVLADDLGSMQRSTRSRVMKFAMTGAGGLVGSALRPMLTAAGHEVVQLVRREPASKDEVQWSTTKGVHDPAALAGVDVVVHLAGENIAAGRWTNGQKAKIRDSRVEGTRALSESLCSLETKPRALVCASAIGYYGDRGEEQLDEGSSRGNGFLAEVCGAWEAATAPASEAGIRTVNARFGVILSPRGGALKKMLLPFKLGSGGRVGSGDQYMSWIALDDAAGALVHLACEESLRGPVNVVGPEPVTNAEFTKILGKVLSRPTILPLPAFGAKLALGEMAEELLLASQRVAPRALLSSGYTFRFTELEDALRHMLGRAAA